MSCAGCEESSVVQRLADAGIRIVRVKNLHGFSVHDDRDYVETIPTMSLSECSEMEAMRVLFEMHRSLSMLATVTRLKIEGDARVVAPGRALYYESHVHLSTEALHLRAVKLKIPRSRGLRGKLMGTIRAYHQSIVETRIDHLYASINRPPQRRIEATVLDTNTGLDKEWMSS